VGTSWQSIFDHSDLFVQGTLLTIEVSVVAFVLAFLIGLVGAAGRRSKYWLPRAAAGVFVEVIRNTPVLLQVFVAYFALPSLGLPLTRFEAGVFALAINVGAYLTEILRSGIEAVPRGQREAGQVLALSRWVNFRHVVMPQALRNVYPAVVNQFVQIILGTSLLSAIALPELTGTAQTINSQTLLTMQVFTVALVIYLVLTNAVSLGAAALGRVLFRPPLRTSVRPRLRLRPAGVSREGTLT
jgi:polar amino acid transport system permease protein